MVSKHVNGGRLRRRRTFSAWAFLLTTSGFIASSASGAELPLDAPLPAGAQAAGEPGRYRSPRNYEETLDFYRRLFHQTGGVRWRFIVNQPDVRARHVASLRQRTRWSGINISDHHGDVGIYVLKREADPNATSAAPPKP